MSTGAFEVGILIHDGPPPLPCAGYVNVQLNCQDVSNVYLVMSPESALGLAAEITSEARKTVTPPQETLSEIARRWRGRLRPERN